MFLPLALIEFPEPTRLTLIVLGCLFAGLLVLAVYMANRGGRDAERRRLVSEWQAVTEILKDRELSDTECDLMRGIIKKYAPKRPLRALTLRHEFNRCVDSEMEKYSHKKNERRYEELGSDLRAIRTSLSMDYLPVGQQIFSTREIYSGQWLHVAPGGISDSRRFRMMVESVDEAYIYLSPDAETKKAMPNFAKGQELRCWLWRDEDARYVFNAVVAAFDDPPPIWRILHTSKLERNQARAHYRVRHDQPAAIGVLNAPVDGSHENLAKRRVVTRLRGRVTSLSAGGCALVVHQAVSKQVLLRVPLQLSAANTEEVEAKIISVSAISGGRNLLRTTFVGLNDDKRDRIARYVLKRQQQLIQVEEEKG